MTGLPLATERLTIRACDPVADVRAVHGIDSLPEVCAFLPYGPRSRDEVARRLAADEAERVTRLVVEAGEPVNGGVIGHVVIFDGQTRHHEIGYVFHPAAWGKGYATEAVRAVAPWALARFGWDHVGAVTDPENIASQRVLLAAGFAEASRGEDELGPIVTFERR